MTSSKKNINNLNIIPEDSEPLLALYTGKSELFLMPFGESRAFVFVPGSLQQEIEDLPSNLYLELRGRSTCCDRFYSYLCHWGTVDKVKLALDEYWKPS